MHLPTDLHIALLTIVLISAGLFLLTLKLGRKRIGVPLAILAVIVLLTYAIWLADSPVLSHVLPVPNVLLWGNLELPMAALLGGVAWVRLPGPKWQRILCVGVLCCIGTYREIEPLLGHAPPIRAEAWTADVCRQSSLSSCSAAAAVTLLKTRGITASEAEMIDTCLTRVEGTTTLGLYRGLMLKTAGTRWTIYADDPPKEDIDHWRFPAVVTITVAGGNRGQRLLSSGVGHSIVVFGIDAEGKYEVGDPLAGRQRWTREALMNAYGGDVVSLVERNEK